MWLRSQEPLELVENHDKWLALGDIAEMLQRRVPVAEGERGVREPSDLRGEEVEMAALLALIGLEIDNATIREAPIQQVALTHPASPAHHDQLWSFFRRLEEASPLFFPAYHAFIVAKLWFALVITLLIARRPRNLE
jgi:hypothetical protein